MGPPNHTAKASSATGPSHVEAHRGYFGMGHGYRQEYARMQQGMADLPEDGGSRGDLSEAVKPAAITSCQGTSGSSRAGAKFAISRK
jgi:hypothetical protein